MTVWEVTMWYVRYIDFAGQEVTIPFFTEKIAVEWTRWAERTGYETPAYFFQA